MEHYASEVRVTDTALSLVGKILFDSSGTGFLRVWKRPEPGCQYVIGGDPAEGLEHGDFSCLQVFKRPIAHGDLLEQVAEWHGKTEVDLFAEQSVWLAVWYNMAWLGIERNNQGFAVVKRVRKEFQYPYQFWEHRDMAASEPVTERVGWHTSVITKPDMVSAMVEVVRDELILLRSAQLVGELMSFVTHANGKTGARGRAFDDRAMAAMIALQMHIRCPFREQEEKRVSSFLDQFGLTQRDAHRQFIRRLKEEAVKRSQGEYYDPEFIEEFYAGN